MDGGTEGGRGGRDGLTEGRRDGWTDGRTDERNRNCTGSSEGAVGNIYNCSLYMYIRKQRGTFLRCLPQHKLGDNTLPCGSPARKMRCPDRVPFTSPSHGGPSATATPSGHRGTAGDPAR